MQNMTLAALPHFINDQQVMWGQPPLFHGRNCVKQIQCIVHDQAITILIQDHVHRDALNQLKHGMVNISSRAVSIQTACANLAERYTLRFFEDSISMEQAVLADEGVRHALEANMPPEVVAQLNSFRQNTRNIVAETTAQMQQIENQHVQAQAAQINLALR